MILLKTNTMKEKQKNKPIEEKQTDPEPNEPNFCYYCGNPIDNSGYCSIECALEGVEDDE